MSRQYLTAMRIVGLLIFWSAFQAGTLVQAEEGGRNSATGILWDWTLEDFRRESYRKGISSLFTEYEQFTGRKLVAGEHNQVGLKVFTASGPGLATPLLLVDGVVDELMARGFGKSNLFILDQSARNLRRAGFLPLLSQRRSDFKGVPVLSLDSGKHYHPEWFYESPLPSFPVGESSENDRRSLLPYPLISKVDFWINLPVVMDCPGIGVNCSLANASIWNVQNSIRFIADKNSSAVAATEISAIPELREPWVFTLVSLEKCQFIGGPRFNSLYTFSEKRLLLSSNPVLLDYHLLQKINRHRRAKRFQEIPVDSPLFKYGQTLGLGEYTGDDVKLVKLP